MKRFITAILLSGASLVQAQTAQRTFVSAATGNDANACSRAAPCRQFAAAIAKTSAGGEVIVLDSGGYGVVTISQAVSIISPAGVYAGVTAFSGDAVTINAGMSDVVVLRGLTLNALGGANGITYNSGANLHVEGLVISGFTTHGVNFIGVGELTVNDTTVRNCSGNGILLNAATSRASIDGCRLDRNGLDGLRVQNGAASVSNSVAAANGNHGFQVFTLGMGDNAELSALQCQASFNTDSGFAAGGVSGILSVSRSASTDNQSRGVYSYGSALTRISGMTISGNFTGVESSSTNPVQSAGNNAIRGNSTNETTGTITTFAPM